MTTQDAGEPTPRERLLRQLWRGQDPFAGLPRIDGAGQPPDVAAARHLYLERTIGWYRPLIIVDVGAGTGASTLIIAELLRHFAIPGVVIAVDTWLGSQEHWISDSSHAELRLRSGTSSMQQTFMSHVVARELQRHVLPLPLDSANAAQLLRRIGARADLVHLDASRDEPAARADIEAWWQVLRVGGHMIGGSFSLDGNLAPGVAAAFKDFAGTNALTYRALPPKISLRKVEAALAARKPIRPEPEGAVVSQDLLVRDQLEYTGEFGPELVLFLPFCHFLSRHGLLKTRRIVTYRGMRCFYDDLDCLEIVEKDERRIYVRPEERPAWMPVRDEFQFGPRGRPAQHLAPDLRGKFRRLALPDGLQKVLRDSGRPLLIIHNKHNDEWRSGPVNHISLACLDRMFTILKRRFTVVYIRHGMGRMEDGFSDDQNHVVAFDERDLLREHREVLVFDDLHEEHLANHGNQDVNTFKNVLYSHCFHFISSQGGGAHQITLYSGALLVVLHRRGDEQKGAYADGFYRFAAEVPPVLAVCKDEAELVRSMELFDGTAVVDDRVLLPAGAAPILAALSPRSINARLTERPAEGAAAQ